MCSDFSYRFSAAHLQYHKPSLTVNMYGSHEPISGYCWYQDSALIMGCSHVACYFKCLCPKNMAVFTTKNVRHPWVNIDCIRSPPDCLIDRPGQFISHCDSFLCSQGRQGKRRGMQIKCSETCCTIPIVFLIAGWTVTSKMFFTYLSVCVCACLLFHIHAPLPSLFPQHTD